MGIGDRLGTYRWDQDGNDVDERDTSDDRSTGQHNLRWAEIEVVGPEGEPPLGGEVRAVVPG